MNITSILILLAIFTSTIVSGHANPCGDNTMVVGSDSWWSSCSYYSNMYDCNGGCCCETNFEPDSWGYCEECVLTDEVIFSYNNDLSESHCNDDKSFTFVHKNDDVPRPLIAFAHGFITYIKDGDYRDLFINLVNSGYTVAASNGCYGWAPFAAADDQVKIISKLKAQNNQHIDWNAPVTIAGHSMGGFATYINSAHSDELETLNIKSAWALSPWIGSNVISPTDFNKKIPFMFMNGENDMVTTPRWTRNLYEKSAGQKVLLMGRSTNHQECGSEESLGRPEDCVFWDNLQEWMNCYVHDDSTSCDNIYNDKLCSDDAEDYSECRYEDGNGKSGTVVPKDPVSDRRILNDDSNSLRNLNIVSNNDLNVVSNNGQRRKF